MFGKKLIEEYINNNDIPYDTNDLLDRIANNRIVSAGQKRYIDKAVAYAKGKISPDNDDLVTANAIADAAEKHEKGEITRLEKNIDKP